MIRRGLLLGSAFFMLSAGAHFGISSDAQADELKSVGTTPSAVVELFTSQGCSSCPPADKVLGKIKRDSDVLAIAWHVDYWDYIGWKDTFAAPEFTKRQRAYAQSLRERQIYTPQAIVNGFDHVVGSSLPRIKALLHTSKSKPAVLDTPVDVLDLGSDYKINVKSDSTEKGLYVQVVFLKNEANVKITRGENRGETLTYHNIVVGAETLGAVKSGGFTGSISKADVKAHGADGIAILVQAYSDGTYPNFIRGAKLVN